jgi:hypothetical protein
MIVTTTDVVPKCGKNWKFTESMIRNLAEQFRTPDRLWYIDQLFAGMEVQT